VGETATRRSGNLPGTARDGAFPGGKAMAVRAATTVPCPIIAAH